MASSSVTAYATSLTNMSQPAFPVPEHCLVFNVAEGEFIPWKNPGNIITQKTELMVDTVVGYIALSLVFISFPCNIFNMIVFWKHGIKERINLCLFCLSLADFSHMFFTLVFNVDRLYYKGIGPVTRFIMDNHLAGLRNIGWLSGFISVVIACERCLCVVSPLRSKTILKTRTTAVILVVALVPLAVGQMLVGLRWGLVCVYDMEYRFTYETFYYGSAYAQHKALINGLSLYIGGIQPCIYISIMTITTIITAVKLKRMVNWRQKTSSSTMSSREVALTRSLIAVAILFLICSLPLMITGTMTMFVKEFSFRGQYYNLGKMCVTFFELASYINATCNFFIFYTMGSKYRQTLWSLFQCCGITSELSGEADEK